VKPRSSIRFAKYNLYIDRANANHAKIKYVFETHFHADFVSGHLDLKKKANAEIVFGPTANPSYEATIAEDNQIFIVGKCQVKAIHTPGHTLESTTYLIIDEEGKEHGLITGDTLFIGDVGRPDLAQHVIADLTQDKLAGYLFDSLRNKIMPLSDDLIVYPNHGAGSACGKMMSKETTDTLGHQKSVNYALNPKLSKKEFIEIVLSGLTAPPVYFPQNVLMNIRGYESLDVVLERALSPLNVDAFEAAANETGALILDTRESNSFAKAFIPNSVNIGIDGNFAQWVGEMVTDLKQPILLVTELGREKECAIRLSRVGYDNTLGYLEGGMITWIEAGKEIDQSRRISPADFTNEIISKKTLVIDVRKKSEFDSEHVLDSLNIPLNEINVHLSSIPKTEKFLLICAGGYRSMIAASILRQRGWNNFVDVEGGFAEIKKTNAPCSNFVCPTTLL
jgi:glyoxylase-like metal-dependent hydrolase (beta-lactamase superfamily II)/rhodanese-related sulfurtransferase